MPLPYVRPRNLMNPDDPNAAQQPGSAGPLGVAGAALGPLAVAGAAPFLSRTPPMQQGSLTPIPPASAIQPPLSPIPAATPGMLSQPATPLGRSMPGMPPPPPAPSGVPFAAPPPNLMQAGLTRSSMVPMPQRPGLNTMDPDADRQAIARNTNETAFVAAKQQAAQMPPETVLFPQRPNTTPSAFSQGFNEHTYAPGELERSRDNVEANRLGGIAGRQQLEDIYANQERQRLGLPPQAPNEATQQLVDRRDQVEQRQFMLQRGAMFAQDPAASRNLLNVARANAIGQARPLDPATADYREAQAQAAAARGQLYGAQAGQVGQPRALDDATRALRQAQTDAAQSRVGVNDASANDHNSRAGLNLTRGTVLENKDQRDADGVPLKGALVQSQIDRNSRGPAPKPAVTTTRPSASAANSILKEIKGVTDTGEAFDKASVPSNGVLGIGGGVNNDAEKQALLKSLATAGVSVPANVTDEQLSSIWKQHRDARARARQGYLPDPHQGVTVQLPPSSPSAELRIAPPAQAAAPAQAAPLPPDRGQWKVGQRYTNPQGKVAIYQGDGRFFVEGG